MCIRDRSGRSNHWARCTQTRSLGQQKLSTNQRESCVVRRRYDRLLGWRTKACSGVDATRRRRVATSDVQPTKTLSQTLRQRRLGFPTVGTQANVRRLEANNLIRSRSRQTSGSGTVRPLNSGEPSYHDARSTAHFGWIKQARRESQGEAPHDEDSV